VPILQLTSQGTNAEDVRLFVGTRTPNGLVSGNPGDLYVRHNGTSSSLSLNTGAADSNTTWLDLGTGSLPGIEGNIYANLVFYTDPSDRNSYPSSGTTVIDLMGNGSSGTLTTATLVNGNFQFDGASGSLSFAKNSTLDNVFAGGGTVISFVRPNTSGEGGEARVLDTTQSGDAGWYLAVTATVLGKCSFRFQRNFDVGAGGRWTSTQVADPITGVTAPVLNLGPWNCIAVTYDDSSTANDPVMYFNGASTAVTENDAPLGNAITDAGNALFLGNRSDDTFTFDGDLGPVLLFDRILSATEVRTVYNLFALRFALGASGIDSSELSGQSIYFVAGSLSATVGATGAGGDLLFVAGSHTGSSASRAGDVVIRAGNLTGSSSGRAGNLTVLSGAVTNAASGANASTAEFGAGAHGNGNQGGTCTIHAGDNTDDGDGGVMIVRGGDCITATATNDGGGSLAIRAGNSRNITGGSTYIASGGVFNGTAGSTGDIFISTQRSTFGPFVATGGTSTDTGSISILTTGAGSVADATGDITIQTGDVSATTGVNVGDITIRAGAATDTTQANATSGTITIVAGLNAGGTNSVAGSITLTAGSATGSGATTGTGGDITLTAGNIAKNSTASRAGNISLTCGSATGTSGAGGSWSAVAGAATGTGAAGTVVLTAGAGGTSTAGGSVTISGGAGGSTSGNGGALTLRGGTATNGAGGAVSITGRNASGTNRSGGAVTITSGNAVGISQGGQLLLQAGAGDAASTGAGGVILMIGGTGGGGGAGGNGGSIGIEAGSAIAGNQSGGSLGLSGGAGAGNGNGGDVNKTPGITSTGRPGLEFSLGATADAAVLSPTALAAGTTQNYTATNIHTRNALRLTPDAAGSALGGLERLTGQDGRTLWIFNIGTVVGQTLTLNHQDGGSTASNQFFCPAATNVVIPFGGAVRVWYDPTSTRWRVLGA
jgi:hypothetical protein